MGSRDVKSWQLFGIISGFCSFYALFLPFKEIPAPNNTTENIYVYNLIISTITDISNYVLNEPISSEPLYYVSNYLILISLIIMIFSAIILLWTSISGNIFISILCSFIYTPLSLSFILYSIYTANVVSAGHGYYLLLVGSLTAFSIPFVYFYRRDVE